LAQRDRLAVVAVQEVAPCAVHVAAGQVDNPLDAPVQALDHAAGVGIVPGEEVDRGIRRCPVDLPRILVDLQAIAGDIVNVQFFGALAEPPVEDDDVMPSLLQAGDNALADKTRAADEQDAHWWISSPKV